MEEKEICEKILKGLPNEIYNKIELRDNFTISQITKNIEKYELSKLLRRNEDNSKIEELSNEVAILKQHIKNLSLVKPIGTVKNNFQ